MEGSSRSVVNQCLEPLDYPLREDAFDNTLTSGHSGCGFASVESSSIDKSSRSSALYFDIYRNYVGVCRPICATETPTTFRVIDRAQDTSFYLGVYNKYSRVSGKWPVSQTTIPLADVPVISTRHQNSLCLPSSAFSDIISPGTSVEGASSDHSQPLIIHTETSGRLPVRTRGRPRSRTVTNFSSTSADIAAAVVLQSRQSRRPSPHIQGSAVLRNRRQQFSSSHTKGIYTYLDHGDCICYCRFCSAQFWYAERLKGNSLNERPTYHLCCGDGRLRVQRPQEPPIYIKQLFQDRHFMDNIRAYNQMFAMTSFGAKIDDSINAGRGPYVFKVTGQIYHWIGSLCPPPGQPPRFLQLYIYDTDNEVSNRMKHFGGIDNSVLDPQIVEGLLHFLDSHNQLVQLFRTARDKCRQMDIPEFKIRLYNAEGYRGYELPTSNTLGAMVFESGITDNSEFDIIIESRDGPPQRVNKLHPSYMGLQFPLLFLYGEHGYYPHLKLRSATGVGRGKRVSMLAYYRYQLHFRLCQYDHLFRAGRLFQQYVVGVFCAVEQNRLDYIRRNQNDIRGDYLSGLYDAISKGEREGYEAGGRIILPMGFIGGPRYMYAHYLDALAICRKLGNPQFFITFTCNVNWPEIKRFMSDFPLLTPVDRADVICRIFQQKIDTLLIFLKRERPFGKVTGVLYTVEFQKRGLPHCHTLLWIDSVDRVTIAEDIDRFISAELPDPSVDQDAYNIVSELMMHGPCGSANSQAVCTKDGKCTKKFPKQFNAKTFFDANGHVHYQRRDTGITTTRNKFKLDNSYVVPYNRHLLLAFRAHINVEYCGWSMLIKYLFKYISKGTDRVFARISNQGSVSVNSIDAQRPVIDEIKNYVEGRFICAHEAYWRILKFDIHRREPAVQILAVHLENMQRITFRDDDDIHAVVHTPGKKNTTLTEWFTFNETHDSGRHLTYLDFPSDFVWYPDRKSWSQRKNSKSSIGRLAYVHPASGELFFLRMLLCHQKGCKDFLELRVVNNILYQTYRAACQALGLLGDDKEWEIAFEEACVSATPKELRFLFSHILLYCDVADPLKLWNKYWKEMSYDMPKKVSEKAQIADYQLNARSLEGYTLYEIEGILINCGKSLNAFGLPSPPADLLDQLNNRLLMEEKNYNTEELAALAAQSVPLLNREQRKIYDDVIHADATGRQALIFVYGHGGTGKTFVWKTIINKLRSTGKIVLAVASSGVASLLLPSGRTAHSRFKLPFELTEESLCKITKNTQLSRLLADTSLIIWDEAPMNDRRCFEALDRTLRDVVDQPSLMFGGRSVLLGGDFRQTLPVKKGASKIEIISSCISESVLWSSFKVLTLSCNMRLEKVDITMEERSLRNSFAQWLLNIGDGDIGEPVEDDPENSSQISIPSMYCIHPDEAGLSNLINFIYDDATLQSPSALTLQGKAIVCPKNETADIINSKVLDKVKGESVIYLSQDEAIPIANDGGEAEMLYPVEHLNTFKLPGFPPHQLELKVGSPVMLLRNMNIVGGLCNGTRMIVRQLQTKIIEVQIITGTRVGEKVFLHRISLTHKDPNLPFTLKRKQFPIKLCYAMTINKSQGQSLNKIGVYLPHPVFGHGQLYVALSRATTPHGLKILIEPQENFPMNTTRNIVYKDFLQKIHGVSPCG